MINDIVLKGVHPGCGQDDVAQGIDSKGSCSGGRSRSLIGIPWEGLRNGL